MATNERLNTGTRWKPLVPGDAFIEPTPTAIYIGGAGTVVAVGDDGVTASFVCGAGQMLEIQPRKVLGATDATGIVAVYND